MSLTAGDEESMRSVGDNGPYQASSFPSSCYFPRMEEVRLFDTATRAVKPLTAGDGKELKFYACGPTVYGPAHIGNFRSFVVQDLLVRQPKPSDDARPPNAKNAM